MATAEEQRFVGYPIQVESAGTYHPKLKHPLLYPIHINDAGQIIQETPAYFSHPVYSHQVVDLSDRIKSVEEKNND